MSFSMTTEQVRNRTKWVTRRLGWMNIKLGEVHQAIEKGQGLKKGEHVMVICKIIPLSSHWEPLRRLLDDPVYGKWEVIREGFPEMSPAEFVEMFCEHNKCTPDIWVNRIEFRYA